MSKVLLIIPPCFTNSELDFEIGFPVNLALLGNVARSEGWDIEYLDMTLEEKEGYDSFAQLEQRLKYDHFQLVGISNHTVRTSITTRKVAERVKSLSPRTPVVVGGVNATFMTSELLESCSEIDYVLRGFAQPGFRALLRELLRSEATHSQSIAGLASRRSGVLHEEPMPVITPDDFVVPSLQGLNVSRYLEWTTTYPLLTHIGCSFSCNFCTSVMPGPYQNKEVYRPIPDVISEMKNALAAGFRRFFMSANIFTSRKEYCLDLCEAVQSNEISNRSTWVCMTRVEFVDEDVLQAMRSAGCTNIAFGVETADGDDWTKLRKGRFSEHAILKAFRLTKSAGIGTTAFLMLGAPSQTPASLERTIELVRELAPDYRVISFFQPFPGTPYWVNPEKFGLSDIAPLSEWNFHEAPICRTKHFNKEALEDAATRLFLEVKGGPRLSPSADTLLWVHTELATLFEAPEEAAKVFSLVGTPYTITDALAEVTATHGARGRLIALYWLSAAMREGLLRFGKAGASKQTG